MNIKIIGANTKTGIKLRKIIIKIANKLDGRITINLVDNFNENNLPILYINNKLISKGIVPKEKDLLKYIKHI